MPYSWINRKYVLWHDPHEGWAQAWYPSPSFSSSAAAFVSDIGPWSIPERTGALPKKAKALWWKTRINKTKQMFTMFKCTKQLKIKLSEMPIRYEGIRNLCFLAEVPWFGCSPGSGEYAVWIWTAPDILELSPCTGAGGNKSQAIECCWGQVMLESSTGGSNCKA